MSDSDATRRSISALSRCVSVSMVFRSDGSAMATATLPSLLKTGTTRYFFAMWRGNDGDDIVGNSHPPRLTTSAPNCAALACVTSAGRTTLLASNKSTTPTPEACGLLARLGDLFGVHEAEVHQHVHQIIVFFSHGLLCAYNMFVVCSGTVPKPARHCQCASLPPKLVHPSGVEPETF